MRADIARRERELPRWRRRDSALLAELPQVGRSQWPQLLGSWISRAGLAGLSVDAMAGRLGVEESAVEAPLGRLLEDSAIRALPTRRTMFVATAHLDHLAEAATQELARRLAGEEVSAGIPAARRMPTGGSMRMILTTAAT